MFLPSETLKLCELDPFCMIPTIHKVLLLNQKKLCNVYEKVLFRNFQIKICRKEEKSFNNLKYSDQQNFHLWSLLQILHLLFIFRSIILFIDCKSFIFKSLTCLLSVSSISWFRTVHLKSSK